MSDKGSPNGVDPDERVKIEAPFEDALRALFKVAPEDRASTPEPREDEKPDD